MTMSTKTVGCPGTRSLLVAVSVNQLSTNPADTVRILQTVTLAPPEATPAA